jgi:hypothetical protein
VTTSTSVSGANSLLALFFCDYSVENSSKI